MPNVPTHSANYRKSGNETGWGYSKILTLQFQGIFASLKQLCLEEKCLKVKTPCYGLEEVSLLQNSNLEEFNQNHLLPSTK